MARGTPALLPCAMPYHIRHRKILPETRPDSLDLLDRSPVMRLDVDIFWSDLAIALPLNKHERGRGFGMSWSYTTINPDLMRDYIPVLQLPGNPNLDLGVDWTTLRMGAERVVILHYVVADAAGRLTIKIGLIATSNFILAKLRLLGEPIIQQAETRRSLLLK